MVHQNLRMQQTRSEPVIVPDSQGQLLSLAYCAVGHGCTTQIRTVRMDSIQVRIRQVRTLPGRGHRPEVVQSNDMW